MEKYTTWVLFVTFNLSFLLILEGFWDKIELFEFTDLGIAIFIVSIFLILNPETPIKNWLVTYLATVLILLYLAFWIAILVSNFEWYYRIIAFLMILPAPFYFLMEIGKLIKNYKSK